MLHSGLVYSPLTLRVHYEAVAHPQMFLLPNANTGATLKRLVKTDGSKHNEKSDYSFSKNQTTFANHTRITVYQDGTLVSGVEP